MRTLDWDSLRFVLALEEGRSYAAAGRALRVTHVTIMRQIAAVEAKLGVRLFERSSNGFVTTAAGAEFATYAKEVQGGIDDLTRRLEGKDRKPIGTVKITTTDTLFDDFIATRIAELRAVYPGITYALDLSSEFLDLAKGQADIAIRPSNTPPSTLVGRRVARVTHAVYAAASLLDAQLPGDTRAEDATKGAPWIGLQPQLAHLPSAKWLSAHIPASRIILSVSSLRGVQQAVSAGIGLGIMPCYMANARPELVRLGRIVEGVHTEIWILTHPDLRDVPRIKAITKFMASAFKSAELLFDPPTPDCRSLPHACAAPRLRRHRQAALVIDHAPAQAANEGAN